MMGIRHKLTILNLSIILLLCVSFLHAGVTKVKIASFNIQSWGQAKMRHPVVVPILLRIVSKFDLIAVQELRDKSQSTVPRFIKLLNSGPSEYKYIVGPRLGRTRSKEQYVFIYKKKIFKALKTKTFPDKEDYFHREPTGVLFEFRNTQKRFVALNFHISPGKANEEISRIQAVLAWGKREFQSENILILGDFNSDCSYYDESKLKKISLFWYTGNNVDTTLGKNNCTYDRIASTGNIRKWHGVTGKRGVIRFDSKKFQKPPSISDNIRSNYPEWAEILSKASTIFIYKGKVRKLKHKRISDHFPIWIELNP